jgi:hypothetical protein
MVYVGKTLQNTSWETAWRGTLETALEKLPRRWM